MRKQDFCLCKADLCCFCYTDGTIPLLLKSEISSFYPSSVAAQVGLLSDMVRNPKDGFSRIAALITLLPWFNSCDYVQTVS